MTFLFTDVEGSTRLWAEDREAMSASLQVHDRVLREAFESQGGYVFTTAGDSFAVAFGRASAAVAAAAAAQAGLSEAEWPGPVLRVRMGLHLGEAEERSGDYFGPVVNTTARLEAAGHGGQVLLSDPVRQAAGVEVTDLGVRELRDVAEPVQIWQLGHGTFPPLRVVDPELTNLPSPATGLVGRSDDVRHVREVLGGARAVTLTAAGGTGKTRLALAVGQEEVLHRSGGVWFVDLTSVSGGDMLGAAVAAALGLKLVTGEPMEQILDYVADKDLLLIIDNCEHLIEESAELAERFLARPGRSTLLVTSRERLDVAGEQVIVVPPLAADDAHSAAVELFARRATELDSAFVLSAEDAEVVVELCRRLDGMPLAIELAAARSTVMTPVELLGGLEDRFRLLAGGRRRQRQRTLEATLDWSYNLLDDDEQRVLRALGVFVGTFDLEAVAAVTGLSLAAAIDLVESLTAKSLVTHEEIDGRSRFRLFETTAAYTAQRLADAGETAQVRDRHLEHYRALARRYVPGMFADIAAGAELGPERTNIVAAFDWAGSQERWSAAAQMLLGAFAVFHRHPAEGRELLQRCIPHLEAENHDLAMRLVCNEWFLTTTTSDFAEATASTRRLRRSPTPLHQVYGYALLANSLGPIDIEKSDQIRARAVALQRSLPPGSDALQASAFCEAIGGLAALFRREPEVAIEHANAVFDAREALGFETLFSIDAAMTAAVGALMLDNPAAAIEAASRSGSGRASYVFGNGEEIEALAHVMLGDLESAHHAAKAHAQRAVTGRTPYAATDSLLILAVLADAEGDTAAARDLILGMGSSIQGGLIAYARYFADRLGVGPQFEEAQSAILEVGSRMQISAHADDETLRHELRRRGWHQDHLTEQ